MLYRPPILNRASQSQPKIIYVKYVGRKFINTFKTAGENRNATLIQVEYTCNMTALYITHMTGNYNVIIRIS